ncbi:MAG: HTH-type transcriptional regulator SutR [Chloroflexi bacterium]|nr:HTH-type transcriptional regulator SutR [Chloroflexota bacterium]
MEIYDKEAPSIQVGERLKELREERGLSIRALGRLSGLSANALSLIERGKSSPSVSTLYKVAVALEIPVTSFFRHPPQSENDQVVFKKASERTRIPFHRGLWEGLGGEEFKGQVEPFMLTLESGANSGRFPMAHSGHEFVLCLRGQLEYRVEEDVYLLEAGDTLLFAAELEHEWRNAGSTVTNAIFVLSGIREGESPSQHHLISSMAPEDEMEGDSVEEEI